MSLLEKLEFNKAERVGKVKDNSTKYPLVNNRDPYAELKSTLHKKIVSKLKDMRAEEKENNELLNKRIEQLVEELINEENASHIPRLDKMRIASEITDEITGYGPITPLLNDPDISEVMVNGPNQVYVEKAGKLTLSEAFFRDNDHVLQIIERIVAPIGRRIDESMPMVDARLPDGSRVNAIIPPLALNGPTITIRKFSKDPFTVEDLTGFGTLTPEMAEFLDACVKSKLNIVVSGGTGSGKTTTLNVLSSFIPASERIVTIEDAAE